MKKIGVLGASGKIGRLVCEQLQDRFQIKGGCRHNKESFDSLKNFEWVQTDLYSDDSLHEFCTGCDLVINCAGPAGSIKERIAVQAQKVGVPYVDTSDIILVDEPARKAITGESICVGGAGYVPGLGGMLLKWATETQFDRLDKVVCYQGGKQQFSPIAFTDIILGAISGVGYGDSYYRNGRVLKENHPGDIKASFPDVEEPVFMKSYLSEEMLQAAKALGVRELHWKNMVSDESMMNLIMDCFQLIMTEERQAAIAQIRERCEAYTEAHPQEDENWSALIMECRGRKDDARKEIRMEFRVQEEETACSLIAAETAASVLEGTLDAGVYWAFEVIDAQKIDAMLQGSARTYFTVTEK